ncbi:MAG: hypothetical protein JSV80_14645 [Acidobacteriota bacterium]|nr:MAG: hypothetical protein JSV80_14645 [Acidobacteriota bacterium]
MNQTRLSNKRILDRQRVQSKHWWDRFDFPDPMLGWWKVGPLRFWLEKTGLEWRVAVERGDDSLEEDWSVELPATSPHSTIRDDASWQRFGFESPPSSISILPIMPDRAVVSRPEQAFTLLPKGRVRVYVSCPIWVELRTADEGVLFAEIPSSRPSDTWFGSKTSGSLCYAARTELRRRLERVALRPHRSVTPVDLINLAPGALVLERLALPVMSLSVFASKQGQLWTEQVTLTRKEDGEWADVSIGSGPPREAEGASKLQIARAEESRSFASRVFGGWFGSS